MKRVMKMLNNDELDFITMDDKHAIKYITNKLSNLIDDFSVQGMTQILSVTDVPPKDGYKQHEQGDDLYINIHLHRKYRWDVNGNEVVDNEE